MTDEEIRIAIAEACGVEFAKWGKDWMLLITPNATEPIRIKLNGRTLGQGKRDYVSALPNYPECLNAMQGAWATGIRPHIQRVFTFESTLRWVIERDSKDPASEYFPASVTNATARQRAEAFLRTLNLWKE